MNKLMVKIYILSLMLIGGKNKKQYIQSPNQSSTQTVPIDVRLARNY